MLVLDAILHPEPHLMIYDFTKLKHDKYQSYLDALSMHLHRILHNEPEWGKIQKFKITDRKDVQKQGKTNHCGVFVLKFLEYHILRRPISQIVQSDMKSHRKEIGYSLLEFCEGNSWDGAMHD